MKIIRAFTFSAFFFGRYFPVLFTLICTFFFAEKNRKTWEKIPYINSAKRKRNMKALVSKNKYLIFGRFPHFNIARHSALALDLIKLFPRSRKGRLIRFHFLCHLLFRNVIISVRVSSDVCGHFIIFGVSAFVTF